MIRPFAYHLLANCLLQWGFLFIPSGALAQEIKPPPVASPLVDSPTAPSEPQFPLGGFNILKDHFKSFAFQSKREIEVVQNGVRRNRRDQVKLWLDENGNYRYKKSSSKKRGNLEFYWVDRKVYRPDRKQVIKPPTDKLVYEPLFQSTTRYWDEFWRDFPGDFEWKKEGGGKWAGRTCDRYIISSAHEDQPDAKELKNAFPKKPHIEGELLVDKKTGVALKTRVTAKYQMQWVENPYPDPNPEEEEVKKEIDSKKPVKPFLITISLSENVQKINKVARIQMPKSAQKSTKKK